MKTNMLSVPRSVLLWGIAGITFFIGMIFTFIAFGAKEPTTLFRCAAVVIGCTVVCFAVFYRMDATPQERSIAPYKMVNLDAFIEYMQAFATKEHFIPKDIDDAKGFFLKKFHDIAYSFKKEKSEIFSGSVQEAIMRAAKAYFERNAA